MALTKEEILDAIASMTVLEVSELIKMMEEKFGVSAAAAAGGAAGAAAPPFGDATKRAVYSRFGDCSRQLRRFGSLPRTCA